MNGKCKAGLLLILACVMLTGCDAVRQTDSGWRQAADIMISGDHKYKACFLTGEVYAGAADDLADLRVVDGQGRFVPFYIRRGVDIGRQGAGQENSQEAFLRTASLSFEEKTEGNFTSVTLHNSQRLRIKRIILAANGNYQRNYDIFLGGKPVMPGTKRELYNLVLEKTNISQNVIDFTARPVTDPAPVIRIHNQDDPPLSITDIQVEYYVDKIVFADEGNGPYQLRWSNSTAQKPHYGVETYSKYIEEEQQDPVALGPAQTPSGAANFRQPALSGKQALNLTIAVVACLLVYMIMRKMADKR